MAEKKKMGRPKIEIDQDKFEKLCYLQCTLVEIAGFFDCSEDTIERWCKRTYEETFAEIYKKKSQGGRMSLRRHQFRVAEKGNVTMLIWLGKQYLGQKEAQTITLDNEIDDDGLLGALEKGLGKDED